MLSGESSPQQDAQDSQPFIPKTLLSRFISFCQETYGINTGSAVNTPHLIFECIKDKRSSLSERAASSASAIDIPIVANDPHSVPKTFFEQCIDFLKFMLVCVLLIGRALAIMFRFVIGRDAGMLLFKMPVLNRWKDSDEVMIGIEIVAGVLTLADMYRTIAKSRKSLNEMLEHGNWGERLSIFITNIREGKYPKKQLILGFFAMIASASKGKVGFENVIERLSQLSFLSPRLTLLLPGSYLVAVCSSICFIAFQWFGESSWVVEALRNLEQNENWRQFNTEHKKWLRNMHIMGAALAGCGASSAAISPCYQNHRFTINTHTMMFALPTVILTTLYNYLLAYNKVFILKEIAEKHNRANCNECQPLTVTQTTPDNQEPNASELVAQHQKHYSCLKNLPSKIGFFSSAGGAIILMPSIYRMTEIIFFSITWATHDDRFQSVAETPDFILAIILLSAPLAALAFKQDYALWTKKRVGDDEADQSRPKL